VKIIQKSIYFFLFMSNFCVDGSAVDVHQLKKDIAEKYRPNELVSLRHGQLQEVVNLGEYRVLIDGQFVYQPVYIPLAALKMNWDELSKLKKRKNCIRVDFTRTMHELYNAIKKDILEPEAIDSYEIFANIYIDPTFSVFFRRVIAHLKDVADTDDFQQLRIPVDFQKRCAANKARAIELRNAIYAGETFKEILPVPSQSPISKPKPLRATAPEFVPQAFQKTIKNNTGHWTVVGS
jgi:hypothetical protein